MTGDMADLPDVRDLLKKHGLAPKRSFSQISWSSLPPPPASRMLRPPSDGRSSSSDPASAR